MKSLDRGTSLLIPRPRVDDLLPNVVGSRCTVICAGPGFGKSTLINVWSESAVAAIVPLGPADRSLAFLAQHITDAMRLRIPAWTQGRTRDFRAGPDASGGDRRRAESLAAAIVGTLAPHLVRPLLLVIDDVDVLAGSESAALLESIVRQSPAELPVVLVGRAPPPFRLARLRSRGEVLDIGPDDLVFTVDEVAELAMRMVGDPSLAGAVHALTGGWPVATRLALEAPREARPAGALSRAGSHLLEYLAEELFDGDAAEDKELLTLLSHLGPADVDLVAHLGFPDAGHRLAALAQRGIHVEYRDHRVSVIPVVAQFLIDRDTVARERRNETRAQAAAWYIERRQPVEALRQAEAAGDESLLQRLLRDHGRSVIASGGARDVLSAFDRLSSPSLDLARLHGEALQAGGDWEAALAVYRSVPSEGPMDAGIAWRIGVIHYMRGQLDLAIEAFQSGGDGTLVDQAMLLGWWAAAAWVAGDVEGCRKLADDGLHAALASADDSALAAAYTAQAMLAALDGDRRANEILYLRALDHATKAGDVLQQMRIHVNRGSRLLEEGSFESAIEECDVALNLADLSGYVSLRALSISNRGRARLGLGRLDEAAADFEVARHFWEQLGSRQAGYALAAQGDVARIRGNHVEARAAYEEARAMLEPVGDQQGLVPATAGLARVLVEDDPDGALILANSAVDAGILLGHVDALLALSEVHLSRGESAAAAAAAQRALGMARTRRDRAGMAQAIEVACLTGVTDPADLSEAVKIWADLGDPLGRARARLRMVQLGAAGSDLLPAVVDTLRELGSRRLLAEATALQATEATPVSGVRIDSLGGFRVFVDGEPVAATAWQSKKARDLLKVLVGRRGRAIHREELVELLWPGEPPSSTTNRLSVALSVIRSVLDPERESGGRFLEADRTAVRLAKEHVSVDLEDFHTELSMAQAAARTGDDDLARVRYRRAESLYTGDLFEEDPYEEWAISERERARHGYLDATRWLAADAAQRGNWDEASRFLFRILERDPYDESAHLDLVAGMAVARRHGEARRLYGHYCARMTEIGIDAAPYPG